MFIVTNDYYLILSLLQESSCGRRRSGGVWGRWVGLRERMWQRQEARAWPQDGPIRAIFFSGLEEVIFILHRFWLNPYVKLVCTLAIQTSNSCLHRKNWQACNLQVSWTKYRASKHALKVSACIHGECMSATQKSWSGLGSEAMAWEVTNARKKRGESTWREPSSFIFGSLLWLCSSNSAIESCLLSLRLSVDALGMGMHGVFI